MRSILALAAVVVGLLGAGAGAASAVEPNVPSRTAPAAAGTPSWADAEIRAVTAIGILGDSPATFGPSDPLTQGALADALAAWGRPTFVPVDRDRLVSMRELDARLVAAIGLKPAAARIRIAARDAGLSPTPMLGTETVARLLGLRYNHPQASDELELLPTQPATRAEAAYSFARALSLTADEISALDEVSATFSLPQLGDWERRVLARALKLVGYPYVWAGTSETTQELWTTPERTETLPGGFDCSGFVWRVYKTRPFPGATLLTGMLQGRTTYAMSGEVKKPARIGLPSLLPGDVIFFGSRGTRSTPALVGHTGIYVGNGWFVHSSRGGVTLQPLQGWYLTTFAWARRPLAEAGLAA